jgi:hypothetical protein
VAIGYPFFNATKIDYIKQHRQGEDRKMARQGKARTQGTQGRKASACHRHRHHRHAIGNCHRHRHHRHAIIGIGRSRHRQGIGIIGIIIGMPSSARQGRKGRKDACHRHAIGMPSSAAAGRRTAGNSTVAQYSHTDFERVLRCAVVKIFE